MLSIISCASSNKKDSDFTQQTFLKSSDTAPTAKPHNPPDSIANRIDSVLEKRIYDTIFTIPEVIKYSKYLDSVSKDSIHLESIINPPSDASKDYSIQVGSTTNSIYHTEFTFNIQVKNNKVIGLKYYDVINDTLIRLPEWRKRKKEGKL
ncbi:MAG TPA: hypothetical protein VNZ45_12500 [Bacteroidia bacterium]|nr:hypothetical protein [Bacteroidia bacterium]